MGTEKPILFSGEMVRAILDGRKTQTRRVIKLQPNDAGLWPRGTAPGTYEMDCPYGKPGDQLWVRERVALKMPEPEFPKGVAYWEGDAHRCSKHIKWRPSIHMPRWASRITLEVVSVRVERLQDITEADALAEGVKPLLGDSWTPGKVSVVCSAAEEYERLWNSVNEKRGFGWQKNPWVWVVEFRKLEA